MIAVIIEPSGLIRGMTFEGQPSLEMLTELVGGFIEYIELDEGHAYINEEGKVMEFPLDVNPLATVLCKSRGNLIPGDYIAGPFVILGDAGDGEETEAPLWALHLLEEAMSRGPE